MQLQLRDDVPLGNVTDVEIDQAGAVPEVRFAAHPHGGPEACWFAFRLTCDRPGPVRLILKHPQNLLGAKPGPNIRPVYRHGRQERPETEEGGWRRLDGAEVIELPDGRAQLAWTIENAAPHVDVAACYPYGPADVEALVAQTEGYWVSETIGVSQQGRAMVRLRNGPGTEVEVEKKPSIYVIARQHSGETPGSWVLDGFLRRLAEMHCGELLVWAVPLTNIDGVVQGDYGKDNFPYDLNRAWGHPPMRHETLVMQRDYALLSRRSLAAMLIDFHAPGLADSKGIYAFGLDYDDTPRRELQRSVIGRIGQELGPLADEHFEHRATYASRWETPWAAEFVKARGQVGFSIETPYQGAGEQVFTRALYRQAGQSVADAVVETLT